MMLEDVMKNLAQRVNNDDVVALMYDYFLKIWDLLSDTMKNSISLSHCVGAVKFQKRNLLKIHLLIKRDFFY